MQGRLVLVIVSLVCLVAAGCEDLLNSDEEICDMSDLEVEYKSEGKVEADVEGPQSYAKGNVAVADEEKDDFQTDPDPDHATLGEYDSAEAEGENSTLAADIELVAPRSGQWEHPCGGIEARGKVEIDDSCEEFDITVQITVTIFGTLETKGTGVAGASWVIDGITGNKSTTGDSLVQVYEPITLTKTLTVKNDELTEVFKLTVTPTANNGTKGEAKLSLSVYVTFSVIGISCGD